MKPRANASFCHWPNDTSTPWGHVAPSCVSSPAPTPPPTSPAPAHHGRHAAASVPGPPPLDCPLARGLVVRAGPVPDSHRVARPELETEEVLEGTRQPRAPSVGGHAGEVGAVDQDPAGIRLVQL